MATGLRVGTTRYNGRNMVLLDPLFMKEQQIAVDEIVEIQSRSGRHLLAKVTAPLPADSGQGIARLDSYLRQAIKVGLGDEVTVEKVAVNPVSRAFLAPAGTLSLPLDKVRSYLEAQLRADTAPVSAGSVISTVLPGEPGSTVFTVIDIEPGPGIITPSTVIEVARRASPEHDHTHKHELSTDITYEDVGGLNREIKMLRELVEMPLRFPQAYPRLGINPPRGIILYGPAGVGKTQLALAVASEAKANVFYINGPEIVSSAFGETESNLRRIFEEAGHHQPAIILVDELDVIAPKRGETGSFTTTRTVSQLLTMLDGLHKMEGVVVIGTTNRVDSVDIAARRPGRFDREVFIGPPDLAGRMEILRIHSRGMPLSQEAVDHLPEIARKTHGFVGADLMELCRESGLNAMRRHLGDDMVSTEKFYSLLENVNVEAADFEYAIGKIRPSAMREVKVMATDIGWDDIGGLGDVKQQLRDMVQMPLLHPETFAAMKIDPPIGILLYGPPGTGKTQIARALARECQANFIPVKGTEIFSKWLGESEAEIRYIFQLARRITPSIIFLDQIDAIAPRRGREAGAQAAERVVSQLLAEMDSLQPSGRVVVLAATNRIDLIDPALLQANRFGTHILIPLPDEAERESILRIYLKDTPLSISLEEAVGMLAKNTGGFSGAELEALCRRTKIFAVSSTGFERMVPLDKEHFARALAELKQSRTSPST